MAANSNPLAKGQPLDASPAEGVPPTPAPVAAAPLVVPELTATSFMTTGDFELYHPTFRDPDRPNELLEFAGNRATEVPEADGWVRLQVAGGLLKEA